MKTTLSVLVLVCLFLGVARSSGQQLPSAVPQPGTRVSVSDQVHRSALKRDLTRDASPQVAGATDANGDGIPDFAQLDSVTREPLRVAPSRRGSLNWNGGESTSPGAGPSLRNLKNTVTDGATFGVAPALITADPFVWRIQDENPEGDTADRATDAGKISDLRLSIDRVETTSTRREFRISILGIQSVDQAVNVWVSNDLKTWNKLDDSMIQTNERGERRIMTPLNAGMQFFRVTRVE